MLENNNSVVPFAKFPLGQILLTRKVQELLIKTNDEPIHYLRRHQAGDWGDLSGGDKEENELSLRQGFRILSAYDTKNNTKIWVITEADRSSTTILLPSEY